MLAVLALIVVVGALLAWGIFNWSSAADWRDRSKASEARLADRVDRLEETRNELADTEERLADVASEKANVADEREVLQQIVADAPDVTEALRDCSDATADVAAIAIELSGAPNPDFTLLDEAIDDADLLCSEALDQADELEETIDDLDL
jgi:septal ring factor EnvC (AmiA/AmiB activator)